MTRLNYKEWCDAQIISGSGSNWGVVGKVVDQRRSWLAPEKGCSKFNIDTICFSGGNVTRLCGVARNHYGNCMVVFMRSFLYYLDPKLVEVLCIREILSWLKELKVGSIDIKTDSLVFMVAIKASFGSDSSYFGLVVNDC